MNKELYQKIKSLREQGKTYREIADELGYARRYIQEYCHRHKELQYTEEERNNVERVAWNKGGVLADWNSKVQVKYDGKCELVNVGESKSNGERVITVRCLTCGAEKEVSSNSFKGEAGKHGHCEVCSVKETEIRRTIAKQNYQAKKSVKQMRKRLEANQIGFRFCKCGALLQSHKQLCDACREKHKQDSIRKQSYKQNYKKNKEIWYKAEVKREARLKGVKRDRDATLKALYEKYHGICYLCGEVCDWNDGRWERGVFRAGGRYPSREHVIALKNGGDDTWSNLNLAHRSCNSKKGAKTLKG